jgi:hypothetical protein
VIKLGMTYYHNVLIGIDISEKRQQILRDDAFLPYIEGDAGVEFRIVEDRSKGFICFGKLLSILSNYEENPPLLIDISTLETEAKKVTEAYNKVFGKNADSNVVKLIVCTEVL